MELHAPQLNDYDATIRDVAGAEHVPLADVHAAFRDDGCGDDVLLIDGVHLSRAGHVLYAHVVARAVVEAVLR